MTRRRRGGGPGGAFYLAMLVVLVLVVHGSTVVWASSCPNRQSSPDQVQARLSLYDADRDGQDGGIQSFAEGDPGATAEEALVADGADQQARGLRVSYRLDPGRRARVGVRIKLDRLDASAYDHLELRVQGRSGGGFCALVRGGFRAAASEPSGHDRERQLSDRGGQRSVAGRPGAAKPDEWNSRLDGSRGVHPDVRFAPNRCGRRRDLPGQRRPDPDGALGTLRRRSRPDSAQGCLGADAGRQGGGARSGRSTASRLARRSHRGAAAGGGRRRVPDAGGARQLAGPRGTGRSRARPAGRSRDVRRGRGRAGPGRGRRLHQSRAPSGSG